MAEGTNNIYGYGVGYVLPVVNGLISPVLMHFTVLYHLAQLSTLLLVCFAQRKYFLKKSVDIRNSMCYLKATEGRKPNGQNERGKTMGTEAERQDARKAVIYDLQKIITKTAGLDQETVEKVVQIMDDYVNTANQK